VPDCHNHRNHGHQGAGCYQHRPKPAEFRFRNGVPDELGREGMTAARASGRDAQRPLTALGALDVGHGGLYLDSSAGGSRQSHLSEQRGMPSNVRNACVMVPLIGWESMSARLTKCVEAAPRRPRL
jgi:hypothetical protein